MYDILYQGNNAPASISDLAVVESGVSEEDLAARFADGRAASPDFNLVVRSGGVIYYWYPRAEEEET